MRPRDIATFVAASLLAALLLLPTAAGAMTGGVSMPAPNAPFINVSSAVYVKKKVTVTGHLANTKRGQRIDIQGKLPKKAWTRMAGATVKANGSFKASWTPPHVGRYTLRAVPHATATLASTTSDAPTTRSIVHRSNVATWFGPEDNGSETACGVKLTKTVLGVAHKTLPCGTQVSFLYHGIEVTVPVIDRGPYTDGVTWDLTEGTAAALGFTDAGRDKVGAAVLTDAPLADLSALGTTKSTKKSSKR
jgi:rare lipoprotein A (peptidoglycan hydrolase)